MQLHLVATLLMVGISWLVGPWMGTELITAILIVLRAPGTLAGLSLLSVLAIWAITGIGFGPLHGRLCQRFDRGDLARLVRLNWWRTLLWSLRLPLALGLAF